VNPLDFEHFFDPLLELSALIDVGKLSFTHIAERSSNDGINRLFNRIDEVVSNLIVVLCYSPVSFYLDCFERTHGVSKNGVENYWHVVATRHWILTVSHMLMHFSFSQNQVTKNIT
jgi:hypothetical protein